MILLLAVAIGLAAGLVRAWIGKRSYQAPELNSVWLVVLAVLPQLLAFHIASTIKLIPDAVASIILICSQIMLMVFVLANQDQSGFELLGLGLGLNFLVIVINGGWMPISPETVQKILPNATHNAWTVGERLGSTKDIILPIVEIKLEWLSDRFLLPAFFPWRVAYSIGDIFIAFGAFWMLWVQGKPLNRD